jgi:hypothetical protein
MENTQETPEVQEEQVEQEVIDFIQYGYSEEVIERMVEDLYDEYGREPSFKEMQTALDNRADGWQ